MPNFNDKYVRMVSLIRKFATNASPKINKISRRTRRIYNLNKFTPLVGAHKEQQIESCVNNLKKTTLELEKQNKIRDMNQISEDFSVICCTLTLCGVIILLVV